ncbi:MAG: hypothetical protein ACRD5B_16965, partial [Nitrososphaeraceae archaeon]
YYSPYIELTHILERRLSLILQKDKGDYLITDWVNKWAQDLSSLYEQIDEIVKGWSSSAAC